MESEASLVESLQQQQQQQHQPSHPQQSPPSNNGVNGGHDATPPASASGLGASKNDMSANMAANRDHLSFRRLDQSSILCFAIARRRREPDLC